VNSEGLIQNVFMLEEVGLAIVEEAEQGKNQDETNFIYVRNVYNFSALQEFVVGFEGSNANK
jgi:hypothetical protein